jgi:hypothetical protein
MLEKLWGLAKEVKLNQNELRKKFATNQRAIWIHHAALSSK